MGQARGGGVYRVYRGGSLNFDFEQFSPDSSLGISEGNALVVGE